MLACEERRRAMCGRGIGKKWGDVGYKRVVDGQGDIGRQNEKGMGVGWLSNYRR
jgi:hypothetical protein